MPSAIFWYHPWCWQPLIKPIISEHCISEPDVFAAIFLLVAGGVYLSLHVHVSDKLNSLGLKRKG